METIPFTKEDVKEYLDKSITFWRDLRKDGDEIAIYYIDAYQSVRSSIFGELLPKEDRREYG